MHEQAEIKTDMGSNAIYDTLHVIIYDKFVLNYLPKLRNAILPLSQFISSIKKIVN